MRPWILLLLCAGCTSSTPQTDDPPRNEVIVMGMIHGGHRTNPSYSVAVVKDMLRAMRPDYVLVEIPPDRLPAAERQFRETGKITESRVRVFPEYTDALFPLTREMSFEIVGCAAWTQALADDRRKKLTRWQTERPDDFREMTEARRQMNTTIFRLGMEGHPHAMHTDEYDRIVEKGLEPYNRLFNDDLGPGGWDNINKAHYRLIARALDAHRGEGKRFVITFGAWHKHWFLRKLRQRDDIDLLPVDRFLR